MQDPFQQLVGSGLRPEFPTQDQVAQLYIEYSAAPNPGMMEYFYEELPEYWQCACGSQNDHKQRFCGRCGVGHDWLRLHSSDIYLAARIIRRRGERVVQWYDREGTRIPSPWPQGPPPELEPLSLSRTAEKIAAGAYRRPKPVRTAPPKPAEPDPFATQRYVPPAGHTGVPQKRRPEERYGSGGRADSRSPQPVSRRGQEGSDRFDDETPHVEEALYDDSIYEHPGYDSPEEERAGRGQFVNRGHDPRNRVIADREAVVRSTAERLAAERRAREEAEAREFARAEAERRSEQEAMEARLAEERAAEEARIREEREAAEAQARARRDKQAREKQAREQRQEEARRRREEERQRRIAEHEATRRANQEALDREYEERARQDAEQDPDDPDILRAGWGDHLKQIIKGEYDAREHHPSGDEGQKERAADALPDNRRPRRQEPVRTARPAVKSGDVIATIIAALLLIVLLLIVIYPSRNNIAGADEEDTASTSVTAAEVQNQPDPLALAAVSVTPIG